MRNSFTSISMIPVGLPVCMMTMLFGFLESIAFISFKTVLRVCFYFYIVKATLWWIGNVYINPDSTRSTIAKFCNLGRSTDKLESMQHKPSLRFQALSFRKPIYLFDGSRFKEPLQYRKNNHFSLGVPFVVVGSLQRYKRQFACHRMLTPQSTPSSDAFENGRPSNPNKDTGQKNSFTVLDSTRRISLSLAGLPHML